MSINWDQADRDDPAYNPSPKEAAAHEAAEDAAEVRREFMVMFARYAQEIQALAAKLNVKPDASWERWARDHGQTFQQTIAIVLMDAADELYMMPDPDRAFQAIMGERS